jgi:DNA-binding protein HU-beta
MLLQLQRRKCLRDTGANGVMVHRNPSRCSPMQEVRENMTTKAELIDEVSAKAGLGKAETERTLGAFFDVVVARTKGGEKVAWPGFGSFSTVHRKARTGRNPQTGAALNVPASTAMKFSQSSALKSHLNQ